MLIIGRVVRKLQRAMMRSDMPIAMRPDEVALLRSLLACSRSYVEFGAGGSTCLAAQTVAHSVLSIDSSRDWLDKVASVAAKKAYPVQPILSHVDIGVVGDWGYPQDQATRSQWPAYHEAVWSHPAAADADTVMVDGRFRVACFMQVMMRCRADTVAIVHDFGDRPQYADIHQVAREVVRTANLSAFVRRTGVNPATAENLLEQYRFVPD